MGPATKHDMRVTHLKSDIYFLEWSHKISVRSMRDAYSHAYAAVQIFGIQLHVCQVLLLNVRMSSTSPSPRTAISPHVRRRQLFLNVFSYLYVRAIDA